MTLKEDDLNVPILFGLKAQGHIPTIEKMLAEGQHWRAIANEIGWMEDTAREWYESYCWEKETWQHDVLPILAAAIGLLLKFADHPDHKWDKNKIFGLALQARKHLKGSTKTSDYYHHSLDKFKMKYTGILTKKLIGIGSKFEHEAIVLQSPKQDYIVRRKGGNPFQDNVLDKLVEDSAGSEITLDCVLIQDNLLLVELP